MSEEEKEAIEIVKEIRKSDLMSAEFDIEELYNAIQTTLNLIDKQDKAINRLAQWVANLDLMVDKQSVIEIIYREIESE